MQSKIKSFNEVQQVSGNQNIISILNIIMSTWVDIIF